MFRRRSLYVLLFVMILAGLHSWILPVLAWPISRRDQPVDAKYLLFLRSAKHSLEAFEFTREFVADDPARLVLVHRDYVRRAESIGAEPNFVETTIQMLVDAGVPRDRIETIGESYALNPPETMQDASTWLKTREPDAQLLLLTHLFYSGYMSHGEKDIDPDIASRLHVIGLQKHGVTGHNWWKSAMGLKMFLSESLRLLHASVFGHSRPTFDWDPDVYEKQLQLSSQDSTQSMPRELVAP